GEGADDQNQGGEADGEKIEREEGEQDENDSYGAGNDGSGVVELGVEGERADGQQDEGYVRVHDVAEDALLERHAIVAHGLIGKIERDVLAVEAFETFSA